MTSVYCKPTSSGIVTNFGSDINTTCCLSYYTGHSNFAQILKVFIKKLTSLKTIFENNAYPKSFVWFLYQKVLGQGFYKKESSTESLKKKLIGVLPFLGKKSMQLRTRLVISIESNLKFCKLKVIFQSPCKLNSLFRYNDSLQQKIRSDIVYRCMCSNCKVTYYRKTYRHVFTRAADHMVISNLTGKRLKFTKQSAVSNHLLEWNCSIDLDHLDILASDTNRFRIFIKESLLIKRDQPQLNKTIK